VDSERSIGATSLRQPCRTVAQAVLIILMFLASGNFAAGQGVPYARSFTKPKAQVEQALKDLHAYSGQKLPILDGFVAAGAKPPDQYERGYYQFAIEVLPGAAGATVVRLSAKITAWYADRDVAKSGYEVLASNGRLELDLLDRLDERLGGKPSAPGTESGSTLQAPRPKLDLSGIPGGSLPITAGTTPRPPDEVTVLRTQREASERHIKQLTEELQGLKEIQGTQAHPQNLVVVKSQAPMYAKAAESSRVLFQAAANDEFEFLDGDTEWIHVSISGDSRGYLLRSNVEVPERIAARLESPATVGAEEKFAGFRMEREETSMFPGDWAPLKGKTVKIYTVQPVSQNQKESGPAMRLNYSITLFQKGLKEATGANPAPEGVVVIFDAADGGLTGATLAEIQRMAKGEVSREAFWTQSYLDPVEAFHPPARP
jgi:hypothetical protein